MNIKEIRMQKNQSQLYVADYLGISRRILQYWEAGTVEIPKMKREYVFKMLKKMKVKKC